MCTVLDFPASARRYPLSQIDTLDAAQSQLDEAEQLFCANQPDAAQRCIDAAVALLRGTDEA
jgi:hypothetical protein